MRIAGAAVACLIVSGSMMYFYDDLSFRISQTQNQFLYGNGEDYRVPDTFDQYEETMWFIKNNISVLK